MNGVIVFLGGGVGATLRYWMTGSVYRVLGAAFPYGTLLVNVLGSLLIGFLMAFFEERFVVQPALRVFLTIGVLGRARRFRHSVTKPSRSCRRGAGGWGP